MKLVPVFKIKVIYKSGATHTFEALQFSLKNGTCSWVSANRTKYPLELGGPEIAAVWQVGHRWTIKWRG